MGVESLQDVVKGCYRVHRKCLRNVLVINKIIVINLFHRHTYIYIIFVKIYKYTLQYVFFNTLINCKNVLYVCHVKSSSQK